MESLIGNRFLFSCKQNSFLQERFCTWPRFAKVRIFRSWKWPIFKVIQNRWHSDSADVLKSQKCHENCDLAAK